MKIHQFYLILATIVMGCAPNTKKNSNVIDFATTVRQEVLLENIAEPLGFVFLQFDKNNPVGKIANLKTTADYIFIADYQNKLFVFKKNGDLVSVVNKTGEGPNEYISIADFTITHDQKSIYILDPDNKKVLQYGIMGNYINNYHMDYHHAAHISTTKSGDFILYQSARFSDDGANIFIMDPYFKVKSKLYYTGNASDLKKSPYLFDTKWYDLAGSTYYKEYTQDTIYTINSQDRLEPHIYVDLRDKKMPNEYFTKMEYYQKGAANYYQLIDVAESSNYFFLTVLYNNLKLHFLYTKADRKLIELSGGGLKNNELKQGFWPSHIDDQGIMYQIYDSEELKEQLNAGDKAEKVRHALKSNDNPVLVISKLKD